MCHLFNLRIKFSSIKAVVITGSILLRNLKLTVFVIIIILSLTRLWIILSKWFCRAASLNISKFCRIFRWLDCWMLLLLSMLLLIIRHCTFLSSKALSIIFSLRLYEQLFLGKHFCILSIPKRRTTFTVVLLLCRWRCNWLSRGGKPFFPHGLVLLLVITLFDYLSDSREQLVCVTSAWEMGFTCLREEIARLGASCEIIKELELLG